MAMRWCIFGVALSNYIQWNPYITDTIQKVHFGRYVKRGGLYKGV